MQSERLMSEVSETLLQPSPPAYILTVATATAAVAARDDAAESFTLEF